MAKVRRLQSDGSGSPGQHASLHTENAVTLPLVPRNLSAGWARGKTRSSFLIMPNGLTIV